jgi:hypothetical protein
MLEYYNINRTICTSSILQVKKKLYSTSVGNWKNYRRFLYDFMHKLENDIANLEVFDGLSFPDTINWHFDVEFDYGLD